MSDNNNQWLKRIGKFIMAIINGLIMLPYLIYYGILTLFGLSNVNFARMFALAVTVALVLSLLQWLGWLPLDISPLFNVLLSLLIIAVIVGVGYLFVKQLSGLARIVGIVLVGLIVFVVYSLLRLKLPDPIPSPRETLKAPNSAIDALVAKGGDRESLEKTWNSWRQQYYQTSQGNEIVPYHWFHALEQKSTFELLQNKTPFLEPDNLTRYRVLVGTKDEWNPRADPIGVPRAVNPFTGKEWMSISCASCHSGQFSYGGKHYMIDGGPTIQDFAYTQAVVTSVSETIAPFFGTKFDRFAKKVLKDSYGVAQKETLKADVKKYVEEQVPGFYAQFGGKYPTVEGFARVDALGRGANGQFAPMAIANIKKSDGPVSYPPVWFAHEFDWVQSVAAIQQPMGRNMTEAWGVNARIYFEPYRRFETTLALSNLFWMETYLSLLEPPDWPAKIFGDVDLELAEKGRKLYEELEWEFAPDDDELTGRGLFEPKDAVYEPIYPERDKRLAKKGLCARCHRPQWLRPSGAGIKDWFTQYENDFPSVKAWLDQFETAKQKLGNRFNWEDFKQSAKNEEFDDFQEINELIKEFEKKRFIKLRMYGFGVLGTDKNTAVNFNARVTSFYDISTVDTSGSAARREQSLADVFKKNQGNIAEVLATITTQAKVIEYNKLKLDLEERAEWDGFRPNHFRAPMGYPARPMRGYWSTGPYLHNGSVRDLYQLLSPVEEREKVFYIANTDFDPKHLGYVKKKVKGAFKFDTTISGNLNSGHEFRDAPKGTPGVIGPALRPDERLAIIEYMKIIKDVDYLPAEPTQPERGSYGSEAQFQAALEEYAFEKEYYDYRSQELERRWKILESMRFDRETARFVPVNDYNAAGDDQPAPTNAVDGG